MVFLRTDKNQQPGDTITLPSKGGTVSFQVTAHSEQPLLSLELIANGRVAGKTNIGSRQYEAKLNLRLLIEKGSWVAARCIEEDQLLSDEQLSRYSRGGSLPEKPCRLRYAHTSPKGDGTNVIDIDIMHIDCLNLTFESGRSSRSDLLGNWANARIIVAGSVLP
jgi:hypothetical protein